MTPPAVTGVSVDSGGVRLHGDLGVPAGATSVVLFAHGSGSSRRSPRNRAVATALRAAGHATLLLDLLAEDEEAADERGGRFRFDIDLLGHRLVDTVDALARWGETSELPLGLFGASTGAAAALVAAAHRPGQVRAVVSRGGRPDLAGAALPRVTCPVLLVVGGADVQVLRLNEDAARRLGGPVRVAVVPAATHLFPEPGALDRVVELARDWFGEHLAAPPPG